MGTYDLLLFRKLKERIYEELQARVETLSTGSATTLEEYKYQTGYIQGLKDCLIWAKEVNDSLTGNPQNAR